METVEGVKTFYARSRAEWRRWLTRHAESAQKVWLILYHMHTQTPSVRFQEAIEEAICFGWIDSKGKKRSPESFYLCFCARNPRSSWGRKTRERATRMIREGLMTERGQAAVDLAKRTGTWDAHIDAQNTVIPSDLQKELEKKRQALKNFERFAPSSKRIALEWISKARRPETRQRRILQTVELAGRNQIGGLPRGMRDAPSAAGKRLPDRQKRPARRRDG